MQLDRLKNYNYSYLSMKKKLFSNNRIFNKIYFNEFIFINLGRRYFSIIKNFDSCDMPYYHYH